ncbi:MAG: efflux RND transporter permease subunit [Lentisphaeria bacterium]|nr:efflux RND transporter permease subunit [Lentisphaeria bacterium]
MFLSRASVRRPIAMSCFIIMLVLFGLNSYNRLGLDAFPDVEIPYVTVTTVYPGASPAEIEVDVAKRLEDAVGTIDGLKTMNTTCMENVCLITLEFQLGQSVDVAAQDVRERIDKIRKDLPAEVDPPEISKFDPNAAPVITLMLVGDLPVDRLYDYADETLSARLSTISGVAEVQVSGGEPLELRITLDKEKLTATGLTVNEVLAKLRESNVRVPVGRIRQGKQEVNVTYDSEFKSHEDIGALEIGTFEKRRIYLRDVAQITMESEEKRSLAFYDGEPGVVLKVVKKGDANAVRVIDGVRAAVDELEQEKQLPSGMKLVWVRDSGSYIHSSVDDAWGSIVAGVLLTALILFLFLHELRSTLIVVVSMPVSIVVSFWAMELCGFTFNTFTLLALGTSVGTLVTNSIVVIENIAKHLERGEDPKASADAGAGEVAVPVFASAMTNVVVFGPIAMMTSLVGRFLVPFAVTIGIATLVSLFVSFTLTPILAAILLRAETPKPGPLSGALFRWWNGGFGFLEQQFSRSVDFVCRHGLAVTLLALALFLASMAYLPLKVGMTFVPDGDQGEFIIKLEFPTDYSLEGTLERTMQVGKLVRGLPNVLATSTVVGKVQGVIGQASEGVYLSEITVVAKPKTERRETLEEMRDMFRHELRNLSECIVTINIPSSTGGSSSAMELEIMGDDLDTLEKLATQGANELRQSPEARDVDTSVRVGKPEIRIVPERTVLQNLGIPSTTVGTLLRGSIEGLKGGSYKAGSRSFDIRVKLDERKGYGQLPALSFQSKDGRPLGLDAISGLRPSMMPIQINRTDRRRVAKIYGNPAAGTGLGDFAKLAGETVGPKLPPGYKMAFGGTVTEMEEANADFGQAIVLAVLLTYLLIAAVMESWSGPFLIMFTVPMALIGMFAALYFAGIQLSIFGMLGFVMLIGIVVNNAILIMDDVNLNRAKGMGPPEAMRAAVKNKFRPILMTSIAAVLGMAPMAFGTGIGSEMRASCGIPVIGGLVSSTLLALYVIPALYVLFTKRRGTQPGRGR